MDWSTEAEQANNLIPDGDDDTFTFSIWMLQILIYSLVFGLKYIVMINVNCSYQFDFEVGKDALHRLSHVEKNI